MLNLERVVVSLFEIANLQNRDVNFIEFKTGCSTRIKLIFCSKLTINAHPRARGGITFQKWPILEIKP